MRTTVIGLSLFACSASVHPAGAQIRFVGPDAEVVHPRIATESNQYGQERFLRVSPFRVTWRDRVSLSFADYTRRDLGLFGIEGEGVQLGTLAVRRSWRARGVSLGFDARGRFSLLAATHVDGEEHHGLRWCGSQSEFVVSAFAALPGRIAFDVYGAALGDPLHVTSGDDCLGDPDAWWSGMRAGGHLIVDVAPHMRLVASAQVHHMMLSHDHVHDNHPHLHQVVADVRLILL